MMFTEKQESAFISLDDLARAMQAEPNINYEENPEQEQEWEILAGDLDEALNCYIAKAKTVSINGVNLFGVRRILVDAYEYKRDDDCSVGLLFYGCGNDSQEMALIVVDAAKANLRLRVSDGLGLVSIETVDKLGRRF